MNSANSFSVATDQVFQIHKARWHLLPFVCVPGLALAWVLLSALPVLAVGLLVATPLLAVILVLGWRATVRRVADRLEIRAGGAAASIPVNEIDPGSLRMLDNDQEMQARLERRGGMSLGSFRYGWFGPMQASEPRYFLASNGLQVLAFSTGNGRTQYRISLAHRADGDRLLASLVPLGP